MAPGIAGTQGPAGLAGRKSVCSAAALAEGPPTLARHRRHKELHQNKTPHTKAQTTPPAAAPTFTQRDFWSVSFVGAAINTKPVVPFVGVAVEVELTVLFVGAAVEVELMVSVVVGAAVEMSPTETTTTCVTLNPFWTMFAAMLSNPSVVATAAKLVDRALLRLVLTVEPFIPSEVSCEVSASTLGSVALLELTWTSKPTATS